MADAALQMWGETTPVLEQDHLLPRIQRIGNLRQLLFGVGCHSTGAAQRQAQIHRTDFRQIHAGIALRKGYQPIFAPLGVGITLHRRGGRTQKDFGLMLLRKHHGRIAGMIAR